MPIGPAILLSGSFPIQVRGDEHKDVYCSFIYNRNNLQIVKYSTTEDLLNQLRYTSMSTIQSRKMRFKRLCNKMFIVYKVNK